MARQSLPARSRSSIILFLLIGMIASRQTCAQQAKAVPLDAPYVPTPQIVVDAMLEIAGVKLGDVVYDLGCGDGRVIVTAAKKYRVKAYGCDLDPQRVRESLDNARKNKVEKLVTVEEKDLFQVDLTRASVVTLYLLPGMLKKLRPQLGKLKKGARIVAHDFELPGVRPLKKVMVRNPKGREHTIYLYTVPLQNK